MEGGLATATANIAVLTEDNVALKADNANFVRYTKPSHASFGTLSRKAFTIVAFASSVIELSFQGGFLLNFSAFFKRHRR